MLVRSFSCCGPEVGQTLACDCRAGFGGGGGQSRLELMCLMLMSLPNTSKTQLAAKMAPCRRNRPGKQLIRLLSPSLVSFRLALARTGRMHERKKHQPEVLCISKASNNNGDMCLDASLPRLNLGIEHFNSAIGFRQQFMRIFNNYFLKLLRIRADGLSLGLLREDLCCIRPLRA